MAAAEAGNEIKIGNIAELVSDSEAFRAAFARFPVGNAETVDTAWSMEKHGLRGKKGTVCEIYDDKSLQLIFSDGRQLDFPFEAVGVAYDPSSNGPDFDLETNIDKLPVSVTVHDHKMIPAPSGWGWGCNGIFLDGGCRAGTTSQCVFGDSPVRYTCCEDRGCDYDLCHVCVGAWYGESGTNAVRYTRKYSRLR